MSATNHTARFAGKAGSAIGRGLIAGFAGTLAITLSQYIERKITDKPVSFAPGDATAKALGIEASDRENWKKFSNEVHFTYGTLWGIVRGFISMAGMKGIPASALHFGAIYTAAINVEPDFEVAPPLNEWSTREIAVFAFHHLVYAAIAGAVFDAIDDAASSESDEKTNSK